MPVQNSFVPCPRAFSAVSCLSKTAFEAALSLFLGIDRESPHPHTVCTKDGKTRVQRTLPQANIAFLSQYGCLSRTGNIFDVPQILSTSRLSPFGPSSRRERTAACEIWIIPICQFCLDVSHIGIFRKLVQLLPKQTNWSRFDYARKFL